MFRHYPHSDINLSKNRPKGKIIYQSHLDKPVEVTLDIAHRARPMWEYDVARMDSVSQKLYFNILEKQINDFKVPALCIQSGYSKNG